MSGHELLHRNKDERRAKWPEVPSTSCRIPSALISLDTTHQQGTYKGHTCHRIMQCSPRTVHSKCVAITISGSGSPCIQMLCAYIHTYYTACCVKSTICIVTSVTPTWTRSHHSSPAVAANTETQRQDFCLNEKYLLFFFFLSRTSYPDVD